MENFEFNTVNENDEVKDMGFVKRFINVIVAPSETAKVLATKPRILFPILAVALGLVIFYLARFSLFQEFSRQMIEISIEQSGQQLPKEQLEYAKQIGWITILISTPLFSLFWWLVVSAVLLGLVKVFKGEGKFKQFLSIVGYSNVIMLLNYAINLVMSYITGTLLIDSSLANITNVFAPDLKGSFIYGVIRGVDFFTLWQYAVIGIGIATVSKLSKLKVYSMVYGIYIATVLLGANNSRFI